MPPPGRQHCSHLETSLAVLLLQSPLFLGLFQWQQLVLKLHNLVLQLLPLLIGTEELRALDHSTNIVNQSALDKRVELEVV